MGTDRIPCLGMTRPCHEGVYPADHLLGRIERFGGVFGDSEFSISLNICRRIAGRENHDWNTPGIFLRAKAFQDIESTDFRKHQVQENHVRQRGLSEGQTLFTILRQ